MGLIVVCGSGAVFFYLSPSYAAPSGVILAVYAGIVAVYTSLTRGKAAPLRVSPTTIHLREGLTFGLTRWRVIPWDRVRYIDPRDGTEPGYVSFNAPKGRKMSKYLPLHAITPPDRKAALDAIRVYWPDLDRPWQEQLAARGNG